MTVRWRWAAAIVAAGVFGYTYLRPDVDPFPLLSDAPPVVGAIFWAIAAVIWVWLLEAVVTGIRRVAAAARS